VGGECGEECHRFFYFGGNFSLFGKKMWQSCHVYRKKKFVKWP
jgi:hypothetical protein